MVFKCLVKIKLSLGTSSAATTTPTSTTSLERSLLSLLRLRRGGATLFVAAAKTKSVNSNCLLLGLPASQGKQRFGHGPLEAWTRYAPLLLLFPLPSSSPPAARQRSYGQSRCLSNIYPGIACACANTNKISVNFFKLTHTHAHSHTHLLLFICLASCLPLSLCCCCCSALECNGFVGMKIFCPLLLLL